MIRGDRRAIALLRTRRSNFSQERTIFSLSKIRLRIAAVATPFPPPRQIRPASRRLSFDVDHAQLRTATAQSPGTIEIVIHRGKHDSFANPRRCSARARAVTALRLERPRDAQERGTRGASRESIR